MSQLIAYCGFNCSTCDIYLATQKNSSEERKKIAQKLKGLLSLNLMPDDINCNGCITDETKLFSLCKTCKIKRCVKIKDLKNCGYCVEFPCKEIDFILNHSEMAKKIME